MLLSIMIQLLITLLNLDYKILTAIISKRLKLINFETVFPTFRCTLFTWFQKQSVKILFKSSTIESSKPYL